MRQRQPIPGVIAVVVVVGTILWLLVAVVGVQAGRLPLVALEPGGPVRARALFLPTLVKSRPVAGPAMTSRPAIAPFSLFLPILVQGSSQAISAEALVPPHTPDSAPEAMIPASGVPCNQKGVVTARDGKFWLNGKEFKFVGVNANFLMAAEDKEVDRVLRNLSGSCGTSVIRVFVTDWGPGPETRSVTDEAKRDARQVEKIRSILRIGSRYNLKFILVLDNTVGPMGWGQFIGSKSTAWYDGGYKGDFPEGSYRRHVERLVRALKDEFRDEIFAWELLNEPNCEYAINKLGGRPDGDYDENCPRALLKFVRDMSAYIKQLDPVHMVTTGSIGHDQYGISPIRRNRYLTDSGQQYWDFGYKVIHQVTTIDALVAHHYGEYRPDGPGDAISSALSMAKALNKPFFIEESGANVPGCPPYQCSWGCEGDYGKQAAIIEDFMEAMFDAGAKGFLLWEFSVYPGCGEFSFFEGGLICDLLERHSEKLCQVR